MSDLRVDGVMKMKTSRSKEERGHTQEAHCLKHTHTHTQTQSEADGGAGEEAHGAEDQWKPVSEWAGQTGDGYLLMPPPLTSVP